MIVKGFLHEKDVSIKRKNAFLVTARIFFSQKCINSQNFAYFCNGFSRSLTKRATKVLKYYLPVKSIRFLSLIKSLYGSMTTTQ